MPSSGAACTTGSTTRRPSARRRSCTPAFRGSSDEVALRVCAAVSRLREEELYKLPGVGETIAWAQALLALDSGDLDETLGVALKVREDIDQVRERRSAQRCLSGSALRLTGRLTLLVASMRAGGARVGIGELLSAHRALAAIDPSNRETAYFALRAALCSRRDDIAPFDAAFAEWFSTPAPDRPDAPEKLDEVASLVLPRVNVPAARGAPACAGRGGRGARAGGLVGRRAAAGEGLRGVHRRRAPRRPRRSCAASRGPGPHARAGARARRAAAGAPPHAARPDLRRTMRSSLRTAGDPFERHWREPGERPRPLVMVCDVSGSMEPYARMLLQYMQACVAARRRVEAFVFGTRLTRVTAELRGRRSRSGARPRGHRRLGLVRRHAHRRRTGHAQPRARPPARPRRDRGPAVGRVGSRRSRAAGGRDGAARRAAPIRWFGSTRSRPTRPTSRSPSACRPRCRTSITSWPGIHLLHWRSSLG